MLAAACGALTLIPPPLAAAAAPRRRRPPPRRIAAVRSDRIGLDSNPFHTHDLSRLLWIGPVPGDIAEIEAYCRIFRSAENLHQTLMKTLCDPETGECTVSYDLPSPELEEKVVAVLGCMIVLINRGREEVLSGRTSLFKVSDASVSDGRLPPLALFRCEVKRCCESLEIAIEKYLGVDDGRGREIWRRLQRLKNVCYDAGFTRAGPCPCPTVLANWSPVYFSTMRSGVEDSEVAFWRGGQVSGEGLDWLIENGYRTVVDLREESEKDRYYSSVVEEAVKCGKIEVVNLPVEIGTAPTMEQVGRFAALVADEERRPIYLHSREGVNRTSAMVSRWRQYITRPTVQLVPRDQLNPNGNPLNREGNDVTRSDSGGAMLGEQNDDQCKSSVTHSVETEESNGGVPYKAVTNGAALSSGTDDVELQSVVKFSMHTDPFKAQSPTCDIFSKKKMAQFFKSRKISPNFYVHAHRRKFGRSSISVEAQESPFQSNGTLLDVPLSNGTQPDNSNGGPLVGAFSSENNVTAVGIHGSGTSLSAGDITNGTPEGKSYVATIEANNSSNLSNISSEKVISVGSGAEPLDFVEANMCASTTGVVRIQSRKKAEMFLVRTDGFSCTREKVTESSLAFTHPSTQQQMLMWKSPPKTVLLLKKLGNALMEEAKEVASFLYHQENMTVLVEPDVHDLFARLPGFGFVQTFYGQDTSDLHERVDLVACLGGDGVILHASNLFRGAVPPVVSFNLGSLGFLTSHTFEEFSQDLRAVIHGNNTMDGVYITLRMRLRCEIFRKGKPMPGKVFDVLNEIVVDRGSNPYLSKIECYEHEHLITKVQGDGVIIATPTGSTAYSTAAGGSMVHPNVPCMLFTPICPHSLSFRPVILPDSARLELKIPHDTRSNAWVSFDGKRRQQLSRGDSVRICMSQHPLPTVNKSDQTADWFRSLIRCLNWNERLDQKAF